VNEIDPRLPKRRVYDQLAQIPKAIASGPRLELLDLLAQSEKSVDTLARQAGLSVANASRHLQVLQRAGLAAVRREGRHAWYRIAGDDVQRLVQAVRTVAEARSAEMERALGELHAGDAEPVGLAELRERLAAGDAWLLDVRPADEYVAGHIPGARSLPIDELEARLAELPEDAAVVAYCRGPYCVFADRAVEALRARGVDARRLRDGVPEWRAAHLAVASGAERG